MQKTHTFSWESKPTGRYKLPGWKVCMHDGLENIVGLVSYLSGETCRFHIVWKRFHRKGTVGKKERASGLSWENLNLLSEMEAVYLLMKPGVVWIFVGLHCFDRKKSFTKIQYKECTVGRMEAAVHFWSVTEEINNVNFLF